MADAHARGGDLGLASAAPVDPDADPSLVPPALDVEPREGADEPLLEPAHVPAHVAAALPQIKHDVGHPLARAVIGVPAAPAGGVDGQERSVEQVFEPRTGARGVEGRMLQKPCELRFPVLPDVRDPRFHRGHGLLVTDRRVADPPFDRLHDRNRSTHGPPTSPTGRLRERSWFAISRRRRRGRGGSGRRAALRSLWARARGSSSLLDRSIP